MYIALFFFTFVSISDFIESNILNSIFTLKLCLLSSTKYSIFPIFFFLILVFCLFAQGLGNLHRIQL